MKPFIYLSTLATMCGFVLALAGCSVLQPQPDATRFFVLTSEADGNPSLVQTSATGTSGLAVGIGPVRFPEYLHRREMVTRINSTRVRVSDVNRWAESLESSFVRVLSDNLSQMLGTSQIETYPWYRSTRLDYQVKLNVSRFENDVNGRAQLKAQWAILDGRTGKVLTTRDSDISSSTQSGGSALSASLSGDLGTLSHQIASQIVQLHEMKAGMAKHRADN